MVSQSVTVVLDAGLHARSAALFVQTASKYASHIWVEKDDKKVNAKSIMGIMSLGVAKGNNVTVLAEGEDAEKAVENLITLLKQETA